MANLNIFGKDWSDIVFEGRNKDYGGYKMRTDSSKHTLIALLLGLLVIGVIVLYMFLRTAGIISNSKDGDDKSVEMTEVVLPELEDIEPPVEEIKEEPQPEPEKPEPIQEEASASKSVQDEKALTELNVKKDEEVKKAVETAQKDFDDNTTSGREDRKGEKDGDFKTDGSQTGGAEKGSKGTDTGNTFSEEEKDNKVYRSVQKSAEPIGGRQKWARNFDREFRRPNNIPGNVEEIKMNIQFVVEKDGSVTDIRVLGDKYGLTSEVERVLKAIGKWEPAEQNGKKVRYQFRQALTIRIN